MRRVSFRSSGARLAEAALTVSPGAMFYRLSVGAQQLGYSSSTVDTLGDSLRLVDVLVLDVPALGRLNRTEGRSVATLDRSLHLTGLESEVDGEIRFTTRAAVEQDGRFHVSLGGDGDSLAATLPAGDTVEVPSLWPLRLAFGGGLRMGRTARARVFDPFSAALHPVALHVAAESTFVVADSADYDSTTMAWIPVRFDTVRAFRVDATGEGGAGSLVTWIDAQGRIVRATTGLGFTIERTAFELAYENFRHRDTLRLMRATATPGPDEIVAATLLTAGASSESASAATLRVRLSGGSLAGLDLAGGRQRLAGDTLIVEREGAAALQARYRLPNTDPALHRLSRARPAHRQHRPARSCAGAIWWPPETATPTGWRHGWCTGWLPKCGPSQSMGVADAVRVLDDRRGDANERVVLLVAMARALGLPARPVAGLVQAAGRYYYHAWAEVYLGDWVAVDPSFDQLPADAAHIRLAIGGLVRPTDLVRLLGRLTLDPS